MKTVVMILLRRCGYRPIRQGLRELAYAIKGMLALGSLVSLGRVELDGTKVSVCFLTRSISEQPPLEALLNAESTVSHVAPAPVIESQTAGKPLDPFL